MKNLFETPYIYVVKFTADVLTNNILISTEDGVTGGYESSVTDSSDLA